MKKVGIIAVFLLVTVVIWGSSVTGESTCDMRKVTEYLLKAGNAAGDGDYDTALAIADDYIAFCPNNAATYNLKAEFLLDVKRYEEALDMCDKALSIRPEFVHALEYKGQALEGLGRYTEAIEVYEKAVGIDPESTAKIYLEGINNKIASGEITLEESPAALSDTSGTGSAADEIMKLKALKDNGTITDEEFQKLKEKVIG